MKRTRRATFFVVAILIFVFAYLSFFGIHNYYGDKENTYIKGANDIRWGIDIKGGVEAIFTPDLTEEEIANISDEDMQSAETIINTRLVNQNITDSEVYTDLENKQIIVRFPWQSDEADYDPAAAVKELGSTAMIIFREGTEKSDDNIILKGSQDVESAQAGYSQENKGYVVQLKLTEEGTALFATATAKLQPTQGTISIWMDDTEISAPTVNAVITDGNAIITGMESSDAAQQLADKINAGSLPFALRVDDTIKVVNPTLGERSLQVMLMAGIISFAIVCLIMISFYRLPGVVACISLLGQVAGMIACTSGFFGNIPSFTMTIPGIAGIILSIGMGVDANVIISERIREEYFQSGKTLDGAINAGFDNGFAAIFDGNITTVIVAIILMGVFGPADGLFAKLLYPFMWLYNHSIGLIPGLAVANTITGTIYSFGYSLMIGIIFNFIMSVAASRLMLKSLSRLKCMRRPALYGGAKHE